MCVLQELTSCLWYMDHIFHTSAFNPSSRVNLVQSVIVVSDRNNWAWTTKSWTLHTYRITKQLKPAFFSSQYACRDWPTVQSEPLEWNVRKSCELFGAATMKLTINLRIKLTMNKSPVSGLMRLGSKEKMLEKALVVVVLCGNKFELFVGPPLTLAPPQVVWPPCSLCVDIGWQIGPWRQRGRPLVEVGLLRQHNNLLWLPPKKVNTSQNQMVWAKSTS